MRKTCCIYLITSPSKKMYVGQTINYETRIRHYRWEVCVGQPYLYNSIKKHGWEKHICEIIHICEPSELNDLEIFYIDFYKTFNTKHGMNLKSGGAQGGACSDVTKKKIGDKNRGKFVSAETRARNSVASSGENNPMWGKHHRPDSIELISKKLTNHPSLTKKRSEKTRKKMKSSFRAQRGKTVYQFDLKMNLISTFTCVAEAAELTNLSRSGIKDCVRCAQETAYGFYWSYDIKFTPSQIPIRKCAFCENEFERKINNKKKFCSKKCLHNFFVEKYKYINADKRKKYNKDYERKNRIILNEKRKIRYKEKKLHEN